MEEHRILAEQVQLEAVRMPEQQELGRKRVAAGPSVRHRTLDHPSCPVGW